MTHPEFQGASMHLPAGARAQALRFLKPTFSARQRNSALYKQHPDLSLTLGPTTIPSYHLGENRRVYLV